MSRLPVAGFHLDLVRAPEQLDEWLNLLPPQAVLSAGVVDGRNIWRNDLQASLCQAGQGLSPARDRLWVASSCSLLHVPVSLASEVRLDAEIKSWLAFAQERCKR